MACQLFARKYWLQAITLLALIIVSVYMAPCPHAGASEPVDICEQGCCGDSVTWTLSADGVLKISGNGAMTDYTLSESARDYKQFKDQVRQIVVDDGVTHIGDYAFYSFTNVEDVIIADSVLSIGQYVLFNSKSLKSLTLPFVGSSIEANNIKEAVFGYLFGPVSYPDGVEQAYKPGFMDVCYYEPPALKKVTVTKDTQLPYGAFFGYKTITEIVIPEGTSTIPEDAFALCSSLRTINWPSSLTSMENGAFAQCTSLENIYIPPLVHDCGEAFGKSSGKRLNPITIRVAEDNPYYDSRDNCNAIIETNNDRLILGCASTVIPTSVKCIAKDSFSGCDALEEITFPDGLQTIEDQSFLYCHNLKRIVFEGKVNSIGRAFVSTAMVKEIVFGGEAPDYINSTCFNNITAKVTYYSEYLSTWTEEMRQNYGGKLSWIMRCITHSPGNPIVKSKSVPTCSKEGIDEYTTYCSKCGELLSRETRTVSMIPHTWSDYYTVDVPPSCIQEGSESKHCEICGAIDQDSVKPIAKTDEHEYGEWTITNEPTCMESGKRQKTCSVCGDVLSEDLEALGHDWDGGTVTTPATYDSGGVMTFSCTRCDATRIEEIPPLSRTDLADATISGLKSISYTGKAISPMPTVTAAEEKLVINRDYTIAYKNNVNAGTATLTITGKGDYTGSKQTTFKITQAANSAKAAKTKVSKSFKASTLKKKAATITLPKATTKFGKAKWKVAMKDKKRTLTLKNGKVQVKKNAKKGTYTIKLKATVSATKNYKGATTKVVTVTVKVK